VGVDVTQLYLPRQHVGVLEEEEKPNKEFRLKPGEREAGRRLEDVHDQRLVLLIPRPL